MSIQYPEIQIIYIDEQVYKFLFQWFRDQILNWEEDKHAKRGDSERAK
jgi:hypothetical protein